MHLGPLDTPRASEAPAVPGSSRRPSLGVRVSWDPWGPWRPRRRSYAPQLELAAGHTSWGPWCSRPSRGPQPFPPCIYPSPASQSGMSWPSDLRRYTPRSVACHQARVTSCSITNSHFPTALRSSDLLLTIVSYWAGRFASVGPLGYTDRGPLIPLYPRSPARLLTGIYLPLRPRFPA